MGGRRAAHVDVRRVREPRCITLFPRTPHWFIKRGNSAASPIYHTKSEAYGGVDNNAGFDYNDQNSFYVLIDLNNKYTIY